MTTDNTLDIMTTDNTLAPLTPLTRVRITKGCRARDLPKGISATITSVEPLGAEFNHSVRVTLKPVNGFHAGKTFVFYAHHTNRLSDRIVRLNDGRPEHTIEVERVVAHAQPRAVLAPNVKG